MESSDYGDTNLNHIIEGDRYSNREEDFSGYGYSKQEFQDEELVSVQEEDEEEPDSYLGMDANFDDEE